MMRRRKAQKETPGSFIKERDTQPRAAQRAHYDQINTVAVDRGRWSFAALMAIAGVVMLAFTLMQITPTQVIPYVVEVDTNTRQPIASARLQYFAPSQSDVVITVSDWVEKILIINRHLLTDNIRAANALACDNRARDQLFRFVNVDNPHGRVFKDPGLVRTVKFNSAPIPAENNTLILRAETTTDANNEKIIDGWAIVVNYAIRTAGEPVPFEEFRKNPIGICIASFTINKEEKS